VLPSSDVAVTISTRLAACANSDHKRLRRAAAALAGKGRGKFSRLQPLEKAQIVEIIRADGADTAAYRRRDARSAMGAWLTINLIGFSLG
jgi:hypothetical protein